MADRATATARMTTTVSFAVRTHQRRRSVRRRGERLGCDETCRLRAAPTTDQRPCRRTAQSCTLEPCRSLPRRMVRSPRVTWRSGERGFRWQLPGWRWPARLVSPSLRSRSPAVNRRIVLAPRSSVLSAWWRCCLHDFVGGFHALLVCGPARRRDRRPHRVAAGHRPVRDRTSARCRRRSQLSSSPWGTATFFGADPEARRRGATRRSESTACYLRLNGKRSSTAMLRSPSGVGTMARISGWWSRRTWRQRPHGAMTPRPSLPTATIVSSVRAPLALAPARATSSAQGPPVKW